MEILFWVSLLVLCYIYDGYLRLLLLLDRLFAAPEKSSSDSSAELPRITVLITVYNEEEAIVKRIQNILACDYPRDKLEVMVASDGSTDATDNLVRSFEDASVILFRPLERRGKSDTQNQAIQMATGDIVVFTDAGTSFDKEFLRNIVKPFENPAVGGVDGTCLFLEKAGSGINESQNYYWRYELRLRELESKLSILAVSSGACLTIRKELFRPMEAIYGEDCIIPLDIILQGYKMKHVSNAIAYDTWASESASEFKARVRMTLRNWGGTWSRPKLLNPLQYGGIAFALWSHKLLRWLSPFFLIIMTLSALVLSVYGQERFVLISVGLLLFYLAGFLGWRSEAAGSRLPILSKIYSFLLANIGFLVGVWKSITGRKIRAYRN